MIGWEVVAGLANYIFIAVSQQSPQRKPGDTTPAAGAAPPAED
jgi:hypothetical protein